MDNMKYFYAAVLLMCHAHEGHKGSLIVLPCSWQLFSTNEWPTHELDFTKLVMMEHWRNVLPSIY